jgi:hypothetical protein
MVPVKFLDTIGRRDFMGQANVFEDVKARSDRHKLGDMTHGIGEFLEIAVVFDPDPVGAADGLIFEDLSALFSQTVLNPPDIGLPSLIS